MMTCSFIRCIALQFFFFLPCVVFSSSFFGGNEDLFDATAHPCSGFTADQCAIDDDALIQTIMHISKEQCQMFCHVVYEGDCTFFIYEMGIYYQQSQQTKCELINEPLEEFLISCEKIGGPGNPSISTCAESEDQCKVSWHLTASRAMKSKFSVFISFNIYNVTNINQREKVNLIFLEENVLFMLVTNIINCFLRTTWKDFAATTVMYWSTSNRSHRPRDVSLLVISLDLANTLYTTKQPNLVNCLIHLTDRVML